MSRVEVEQLTAWLWCLRTPIVQAYALRERDGFNLVDTTTAGQEDEILAALAEIAGQPPRIREVLLTHGHDDHIGAAAGLRARTGARLVASCDEAGVIARERPAPPPQLADWEVPLFEQVTPNVPAAPPAVPDRLVDPGDRLGWEHDAVIVTAPGHIVGVFNADPTVAAASARRLADLDAEIACFGHGEPFRRDAAARLAELAR